jgi:FAD dependent oxidoreductase
MTHQIYTTDILVVGGGVGGTAAAIQAARRGAKVILVSEFPWLGGMLTSAGVSVPDGNELEAFQTGLWGEFLRELENRQPGGLDNSWVSFFSYEPQIGAEIFADWVQELPNLQWFSGYIPLSVLRQDNCVTGVQFADFTVNAKITIDGTELGDLLALGNIPYRWGWELLEQFGEPSAPIEFNSLTQKYPVQSPTWVVIMEDFGEEIAPLIPAAPNYDASLFMGAWDSYGAEKFMNYGRLPGLRFMMNWPIKGNDYGEGVGRLVESESAKQEFLQECFCHSLNFAHFIQSQLGRRYGLAKDIFPILPNHYPTIPYSYSPLPTPHSPNSFALHPYYRESRRLVGLTTVCEQDILPVTGGRVGKLHEDAIALGNYANDHHYPGFDLPLQPKSIRWGGRWTGTPFTIPYRCLIPQEVDGFFACEKNISVSHIANGATRLQPIVMGIGQAVGMAAALCIELDTNPRYLPVKKLQSTLLETSQPPAIVPFFNLCPHHPLWQYWQKYYLEHLSTYPITGNCPNIQHQYLYELPEYENIRRGEPFIGIFSRQSQQEYIFTITTSSHSQGQTWQLVTLREHVDTILEIIADGELLKIWGRLNPAGGWLLVEYIEK